MKKIIYGFLLFSASLLAVSCGSDDSNEEILKYTTDKTLAIVKINLQQLDKKLPKEEILKDQSGNFSEKDKEKLELFMNADKNGIDVEKPLYLMTDQDKNGFAISFFGWLTNPAKFEANFSKISGTKIKIDEAKNLIYSDDNLIGAIDDHMIVLSRHAGNPMSGMYGSSRGDNSAANDQFYAELWKRKPLDNKNALEQIKKSLDSESDVSSWINLYGVINTLSKGSIETLAIDKIVKGAGIGFSLNFGEGKIEAKGSTFFNDELKKLVEKYYKGKSIDYSIVKNIDIDNAKSYGLGYMNPDFFRYFLKEAGFETMVNNYLESKNLTVEEITNAFSGQYAFAQFREDKSAAEATPEMDEYGYPMPSYQQPKFLVALGINGAKAKKVTDFLNAEPMLAQAAKMYNNNGLLVFSNDDKALEMVKTNKAAANNNLKKKSDVTTYSWSDSEDVNKLIEMSNRKIKIVSMESSSNVKDGNFNSDITITLDKSKKNVLHYLLGYE